MLLDRVLLTACLLLGLAQLVFAHGPGAGAELGLVVADHAPAGAVAYLPGGAITAVAVSDEGDLAAVGLADGRVRIFEAGTGREVAEASLDEAPHGLWFRREGTLLAAGPTRVREFHVETGRLVRASPPEEEPVRDTAVDEFQSLLVRARETGLWAQPLDDFAEPPERLEDSLGDLALVASPHGDWIAAGGKSRVARVRASGSGQVVEVFEGLGGWVLALEFLPDDRTLVVAGDADRVWLFDAVEGASKDSLRGHRGWIGELAVSPDGRWLATAGSDEAIRIYDLVNRRLRRRLEGHFEEVRALAFTPDGAMLLSGGDDQQLIVWDLSGLGPRSSGS